MKKERNDEAEAESRRILEQISRESQSGGLSAIDRATNRARDHLMAEDVDHSDWAEYWGTRIGRTIGALVMAGLIFWLVIYLVQGE
jgi:tetrahydromethanopterin S-methyltransferase subunit G